MVKNNSISMIDFEEKIRTIGDGKGGFNEEKGEQQWVQASLKIYNLQLVEDENTQ